MTHDRWQEVDKLFQAVIELTPDERTTFLDAECTDSDLRKEVESLITFDQAGLSLVEEPAFGAIAGLLLSGQLALETDQQIGRYRILALLGTGGMSEVYLALDETLNRKVALKLLPAEYTGNSEWLDRFYREARATSALNHPNILTIHEISQVKGLHFIATEFIDGETLRRRLNPPGLKLSDAFDIAIQVGNALGVAHREGIVHRDIKPENIMLRSDGHVKVVDFGLAKLPEKLRPSSATAAEGSMNNGRGVMGTPQYMSPEQTLGIEEDPRSDIFSFGVVLYEMIEGRPPFQGDTVASLAEAIREKQPAPLSQIPAPLSRELGRIMAKLLHKDKAKRYSAIEDAVSDLTTLKSQLGTGAEAGLRVGRGRQVAILLGLMLAVVLGGYVSYLSLRSLPGPYNPVSINRVNDAEASTEAAISPDGKYLAHAGVAPGRASLKVRELSTDRDVELVPPTDPVWKSMPVSCAMTFSQDDRYVYFVPNIGDQSDLYRVSISGGPVEKVLSNLAGPISFSPGGKEFTFVRQINATETALMIASVDGRTERTLATRKSPQSFSTTGPGWSPDGKVIASGIGTVSESVDIVAVEVENGAEHLLPAKKWDTVSRISWAVGGTGIVTRAAVVGGVQIWFVPYPAGEPRPLLEDPTEYDSITLTADSQTVAAIRWGLVTSVWTASIADPANPKQIASGAQSLFRALSWSPDGRIVYPSNSGGNRNIWIMDGDGTSQKKLTSRTADNDVVHTSVSPDGRWIAFGADWAKPNIYNIWKVGIDGSNPVQVTHGDGEMSPVWSPDGKWIVYTSGNPNDPRADNRRVWKISSEGSTPIQLTQSPSMTPAVSPDGSLVAAWYKDRPESSWGIAFIPINGGAPVRVIRTDYARLPLRWTPDGSAITYVRPVQNVPNLWSQPLAGGAPQQLTRFTSDRINYFDWSKKGDLVLSRAADTSELVLIRNLGVGKTQ